MIHHCHFIWPLIKLKFFLWVCWLFGFFPSLNSSFSLADFSSIVSSFRIRRALWNLYFTDFQSSDFSDLQRLFFKIKIYLLLLWWFFFAIKTIFIFIHLNISSFLFTDSRVQTLTEKVSTIQSFWSLFSFLKMFVLEYIESPLEFLEDILLPYFYVLIL